MAIGLPTPCPHCQTLQAQLADVQASLAAVQARLTQVEEQLAKARKDSSTSSKPPSSDIVKPAKAPPANGRSKRQRGGQPGHSPHQRLEFPPEAVEVHAHRLDHCPDCGHPMEDAATAPRVLQQVEILDRPIHIDEHQGLASWCPRCQQLHYAPLPATVERGGLLGPQLTALVAFLKGVCHASFSTIRKFLRDVVGLTVSRGQLAKVIAKVSAALATTHAQLEEALTRQSHLNVDETGHKDNGVRFWTWCFRAEDFTVFHLDASRGSGVLLDVLGTDFQGVLGCDYFSAYRKYMRECGIVVQFCLAHLIRDVKFLLTLPDPQEQAYGQRLRESLRELFRLIHQREQWSDVIFSTALAAARDRILRQATEDVPAGTHAQNLAKRFRKHGQAYFRFVTTPGIEPTNNLAEQAIRFVVIDRHITQGTRSQTGRQWCERIWTVIASCAQQGRSVWDFLCAAVRAHWTGQEAPSLLPVPP
jgi:transposase